MASLPVLGIIFTNIRKDSRNPRARQLHIYGVWQMQIPSHFEAIFFLTQSFQVSDFCKDRGFLGTQTFNRIKSSVIQTLVVTTTNLLHHRA